MKIHRLNLKELESLNAWAQEDAYFDYRQESQRIRELLPEIIEALRGVVNASPEFPAFRSRINENLTFMYMNGNLYHMDEAALESHKTFSIPEFLFSADDDTNAALLQEIHENFGITIVRKASGIYDWEIRT